MENKNIWNPNNDEAFNSICEYLSSVFGNANLSFLKISRADDNSIIVKLGSNCLGITLTFDDIRNIKTDAEIFGLIVNANTSIKANEQSFNPKYNRIINSQEIIYRTAKDATRPLICDVIKSKLENSNDIFVVGNSSSGKSTAVAIAAKELINLGLSLNWFDLNDSEIDYLTIAYNLINTNEKEIVIIVDNIQSAPQETEKIKQLLEAFRSKDRIIKVILIGWETTQNIVNYAFPNSIKIACKSIDTIQRLLTKFPESDQAEVLQKAMGDVLVAKKIIDFYTDKKRIPSFEELLNEAVQGISVKLQLEEAKLLFQIAILGQFEIYPTVQYLTTLNSNALNNVKHFNFVRKVGDAFSIGHRSFANLVVKYLQKNYSELANADPVTLTIEYLKTVGNKLILTTLERIALIKTFNSDDYQLKKIWQAFTKLQKYLYKAIDADPSWNNNMASLIFASETLAKMSFAPNAIEYWEKENNTLLSRWYIYNNELTLRDKMTQERDDFDIILTKMKEEDEIDNPDFKGEMSADEFDKAALDKFHKTWLIGLLLGYEGTKVKRDNNHINILIQELQKNQLPSGAFFPHRVPWVTARVIIGLTMCDEILETSSLLKDACNWLIDDYPIGAYKNGKWDSGTGTWNTDVQVTWMCVNALLRAGYPQNNPKIQKAFQWLNTKKDQWTAARKEIDAAFAIDTLLLIDKNLVDFSAELDSIINWCDNYSLWARATLTAEQAKDESSKVPFIAKVLIETTWQLLVKELPTLLGGLDTIYSIISVPDNDDIKEILQDYSTVKNRINDLINEMKDTRPSKAKAPKTYDGINKLIEELDILLSKIISTKISVEIADNEVDKIVEKRNKLK